MPQLLGWVKIAFGRGTPRSGEETPQMKVGREMVKGDAIMANDLLTENLSEPLNGATTAKIDIHTGTGNLTIDRLTSGERLLASGTLQYFEKQGAPKRSVTTSNGQATLTVRAEDAGQPWFRLPWRACLGATDWQIHLNPTVSLDITAYSGGGNVKLNLADMAVTHLSADTGGGNMDVVLPNNAADLSVAVSTGGGNVAVDLGSGTTGSNTVNAKSGAGNVVVRIPSGIAARVHAASGLGKVTMDPWLNKVDKNTYQSTDYDSAANRVEITASSGAGNVIVETK